MMEYQKMLKKIIEWVAKKIKQSRGVEFFSRSKE